MSCAEHFDKEDAINARGLCLLCDIESLRAQLAAKEREYTELSDSWDEMRDVVLHGIDHFDNDQTNAVLSVIDDHDPRALENDDRA